MHTHKPAPAARKTLPGRPVPRGRRQAPSDSDCFGAAQRYNTIQYNTTHDSIINSSLLHSAIVELYNILILTSGQSTPCINKRWRPQINKRQLMNSC